MMGVEVTSTGTPFEHVFDAFHATPAHRQDVKRAGTGGGSRYVAPMSDQPDQHAHPPEHAQRSEHPSVARFRAALAEKGGTGRIVVLPDSVHTAALAAQALGCEVGAIANSLLFEAVGEDGHDATSEPVLILTSGAHRVDTDKVADSIGATRLKRAKPEFVREHTGQVIGGVSPIAHPRPVRTFLDPTLRRYDEIWAAAGHPAAVFSTTYDELLAMTGAHEIEVN